jgi:hypothetical protein
VFENLVAEGKYIYASNKCCNPWRLNYRLTLPIHVKVGVRTVGTHSQELTLRIVAGCRALTTIVHAADLVNHDELHQDFASEITPQTIQPGSGQKTIHYMIQIFQVNTDNE